MKNPPNIHPKSFIALIPMPSKTSKRARCDANMFKGIPAVPSTKNKYHSIDPKTSDIGSRKEIKATSVFNMASSKLLR